MLMAGDSLTALKIRCRKFFGVVGPAFVQKLVADRTKNAERLKKFLSRERIAYLQAINTQAQAEDLRPLNRASGRFATVFAAGSLAIKYEIFRWNRQALLRAVLSCQLDGCGIPGGSTSRPTPRLLACGGNW